MAHSLTLLPLSHSLSLSSSNRRYPSHTRSSPPSFLCCLFLSYSFILILTRCLVDPLSTNSLCLSHSLDLPLCLMQCGCPCLSLTQCLFLSLSHLLSSLPFTRYPSLLLSQVVLCIPPIVSLLIPLIFIHSRRSHPLSLSLSLTLVVSLFVYRCFSHCRVWSLVGALPHSLCCLSLSLSLSPPPFLPLMR